MTTGNTDVAQRSSTDRSALLAIPAMLALVLVAMPFLPRETAASLLTQTVIVLLIVLGALDVVTLKIPNVVVYPAIAFVLAGTALVDSSLLPAAALGAAATLGVMFVLAVIGRGAMGMGDVKFACIAGCALGWQLGLISLATGFALGGLAAIALVTLGFKDRKDVVPLTPFLAVGIIFWLILAGSLVS
jgi:leader peptidase (prepilin peptidase) / N-methyltransferase